MPVNFIQVGDIWVNLELVTSVELVDDPQHPGQPKAARVHYSTGKSQEFIVPADIRQLADWLRMHNAP